MINTVDVKEMMNSIEQWVKTIVEIYTYALIIVVVYMLVYMHKQLFEKRGITL